LEAEVLGCNTRAASS